MTLLPFPRDEAFVGREDIFEQIDDSLQHTNTAALVGLGGMGKSQIAIEYAYRCEDKNCKSRIFWVRASSRNRFEESFQAIADCANLSRRSDPSVDVVELVYDWLCYQLTDPWLLIYDDADPEILHEGLGVQLRTDSPCVLEPSTGHILITSKDAHTASKLAGNTSCIIPVDCLTEPEAVELLKAKLPNDVSSTESLDELARELDYIPLAISQAVSYMGSRLSISDYLLMLRASEMIRLLLLDYEFPDIRREFAPSNAILKTLWISFERVRNIAPEAACLMTFLGVCHHQAISTEEFITKSGEYSPEWERAIKALCDHSIVRQDPHQANFKMHRVVQLSLREWLNANTEMHDHEREIDRHVYEYSDNGKGSQNWYSSTTYELQPMEWYQ